MTADASGRRESSKAARQRGIGVDVAPVATAINGIVLSHDAAIDLVKALNLLAKLATERGRSLETRITQLQHDLAESVTRVGTLVGDKNVTKALKDHHAELGVVSPAKAAERLGLKEDSVRNLCRRNRLLSMHIGREIWIPKGAVVAYAAERKARRLNRGKDS